MIGTLALGVFGAIVGASVCHELTHAAAAKAAGAKVDMDLLRLEVRYTLPASRSMWYDRCINLAPQIVGAVVALVYLGLGGWPTTMGESIAATGWAVYTLWGSVEDFSLRAAHGERVQWRSQWRGAPSWARLLTVALVAGVVSTGLYCGAYIVNGRVGTTMFLVHWAFAIVALVVGAQGVVGFERERGSLSRGR